MSKVEVIDFKEKMPSTIVGMIDFNGKLNTEAVFKLLEVTYVADSEKSKSYITYGDFINDGTSHRDVKDGQIPHLGYAGPIWGMRYDKISRGDYKLSKFKNSITMALSIRDKNVIVHLSNKSLHLTGIKTDKMAYETFEVIKYNIDSIDNVIKFLVKNKQITLDVINYIKKIVKGEPGYCIYGINEYIPSRDTYFLDGVLVLKPLSESFNKLAENLSLIRDISKSVYDNIKNQLNFGQENFNAFPIRLETCCSLNRILYDSIIPSSIDRTIFDFLIDKMKDYNTYENYTSFLDWVVTVPSLYESEISVSDMKYININYSYSLGIKINRGNFRTFIDSYKSPDGVQLSAGYKKSVDKFLTIYLPFEIPKNLASHIRRTDKKEKNCHKFIIYKTGSVTQSGPHPELNEIAYKHFIQMAKKCNESGMLSVPDDDVCSTTKHDQSI